MGDGWCAVDGVVTPLAEARIPVDDPAFLTGWAVFDTLEVGTGHDRTGKHLERLARSAAAAEIAMPDPALIEAEIDRLAARLGGVARVRVTLTGGGRRVVTAVPVDASRRHAGIRAVRGLYRAEPFLGGDVKHTSRAPWVVAVRRSGADEVLLVDQDGRFTEGTTCGIVAIVAGELWTAPHDGRILESTSVCSVLERADRLGIRVHREGPLAAGPWDGLYVCSTTRDLAPVVELNGRPLIGWDPVGRRLAGA